MKKTDVATTTDNRRSILSYSVLKQTNKEEEKFKIISIQVHKDQKLNHEQ